MTSAVSFHTEYQKLSHYGACWRVEKALGNVCLIHGFGEHIHRYEEVITYLNQAQLNVFGLDLMGHGQSQGRQGDIPSYDAFLDNVALVISKAEDLAPDLPLLLYGHSMGGGIVLRYLMNRPHSVVGALISSPWLRLTIPPPKLKYWGGRILFALGLNITEQPRLNPAHLSRDLSVGATYVNDPLVHDYISARAFLEITDNGEWILDHAEQLKTPILLAHGEDDQITSPKASTQFAQSAAKFVKLKLWPELRHETHFELNKHEVITLYANWLKARAESVLESKGKVY